MIRRRLLIGATAACFLLQPPAALAVEADHDFLLEIAKPDLTVQAVSVDMSLYIGWRKTDKTGMSRASKKAIEDLSGARAQLQSIQAPSQQASQLLASDLAVIDDLKKIYTGIEKKSASKVLQELGDFIKVYQAYQRALDTAKKQWLSAHPLPKGFEPRQADAEFFGVPQDRKDYSDAVELFYAGKTAASKKIFDRLVKRVSGSPAALDILKVRLADCWVSGPIGGGPVRWIFRQMARLEYEAVLKSGRYSPVVAETFLKWRTLVQAQRYGQTHVCAIPNDAYNQKRWEAASVVRAYVRAHPEDVWAYSQLIQLCYMPNIERDGKQGNSNIRTWNWLFVH